MNLTRVGFAFVLFLGCFAFLTLADPVVDVKWSPSSLGKESLVSISISEVGYAAGTVLTFGHQDKCLLFRQSTKTDVYATPTCVDDNGMVYGELDLSTGSECIHFDTKDDKTPVSVFSIKLLHDIAETVPVELTCHVHINDKVDILPTDTIVLSDDLTTQKVYTLASLYPDITQSTYKASLSLYNTLPSYTLTFQASSMGIYTITSSVDNTIIEPIKGNDTAFYCYDKDKQQTGRFVYDKAQKNLLYLHIIKANVQMTCHLNVRGVLHDEVVISIDKKALDQKLVVGPESKDVTSYISGTPESTILTANIGVFIPSGIVKGESIKITITPSDLPVSYEKATIPEDWTYKSIDAGIFELVYNGDKATTLSSFIISSNIETIDKPTDMVVTATLNAQNAIIYPSYLQYPRKETLYIRSIITTDIILHELINEGTEFKVKTRVTAHTTIAPQNEYTIVFYLTDTYTDTYKKHTCTYIEYDIDGKPINDGKQNDATFHVDFGTLYVFPSTTLAINQYTDVECIIPLRVANFEGHKSAPDAEHPLRIATWAFPRITQDNPAYLYEDFAGHSEVKLDVIQAPVEDVVVFNMLYPYPATFSNEHEYLKIASEIILVLNKINEPDTTTLIFNGDLTPETVYSIHEYCFFNQTSKDIFGPYHSIESTTLNSAVASSAFAVKTDKTLDEMKSYLELFNNAISYTGSTIASFNTDQAYKSSLGLSTCGLATSRKCLAKGKCIQHTDCGGSTECYSTDTLSLEGVCDYHDVYYNPWDSKSSSSYLYISYTISMMIVSSIIAMIMF